MGGVECADLELSLTRRDVGLYAVEMRFMQPGSETEVHVSGSQALVGLDLPALREKLLDTDAYGAALGAALFAPAAVAEMFGRAAMVAQQPGVPLRARLVIGNDAPALHGLRLVTVATSAGARTAASELIGRVHV